MASLTGQLVAETYKALLKLIDNDILTASEKQITDGFGGGSNVFIDSQGFLRANKYKVTNGLATQFLKADGSLDSNAYLTSITGSQVITALGYTPVPTTRTITINGETHNLAADNSWTVGGTAAIWGNITGTLSNQTDLQNALNAKYNNPTGTISQYIRGDGSIANFPALTGYVPYSGASSNVNLGEYGITSGFVGFDTTPTGTPTGIGTLYWDSANRTLSLIDGDGDTTLQIGQEERVLVHNNTGATLTDGQIVYVVGSTGELPSVALASNSAEATSSVTFGMVTESIAHGADGFITTSGIVHGLNTLAFTEGAALWLGTTPGTFTQTKPIAPLNSVLIGYVIKKAGGNGSVFVKIQNGYELEELHDVYIADPANNHGIFYDIADGLWKNKSIASALGYTPQAQLSGTGFVKASGTTITYDNSTYLTTTDAASTYQLLTNLSTDLTASATKYPSVNAVNTGLATKQPLDADLTAIAGLTGTSGFLKKTATDTWTLDTSTYLTTGDASTTYLAITTAASTYQRLDKMVSNLLPSSTEYPNSNAVINALALKADAANPVFTGNMTISGATPRLYFVDTDQNPDYTVFIDSGFFYIYDQTAGATRFSINSSGNINTGVGKSITASSFIKESGTASQYLMADGSVSTGPSLSGYVPYTGATTNVDLGTRSLSSSLLFVNPVTSLASGAVIRTYNYSDSNWGFSTTQAAGVDSNQYHVRVHGSGGTYGYLRQFQVIDASQSNNVRFAVNFDGSGAIFSSGLGLGGNMPTADRQFYISGSSFTSGADQYQAVINTTFVNAATNIYGIYVNNNSNVNVSNSYAIHIAPTGGSGSITNKWAIYQNGSNDKNYFAGKVLIGTTTDAGYLFDVNGWGRVKGSFVVGDQSAVGLFSVTPNSTATRKVVLYSGADNNYQFYGFGVEDSTLVYSTFTTGDSHVFFAGASATTRNELLRIKGNGTIIARNSSTSAGLSSSVTYLGAGEFMSTGSSSGYFWENRSGGVTTNSNWYGWYTTSGAVKLWNGAGNLLSIGGSSGNVSIGSDTDAGYKLDVNGSGRFTTSLGVGAGASNTTLQVNGDWVSGYSTVRIQGATSSQVGLGLYDTAGARKFVFASTGSVGYIETATGVPIDFQLGGTSRIKMSASGVLGVGDLDPTNTYLSVKGDWPSGYATVKIAPSTSYASGGSAGIGLFDSNGSTRFAYFAANNNQVELWVGANKPLLIGTADTERLRITNTGVVDFSGNSTITNVNDKFTIGINGTSYVWMQSWSGRPITINPSGNNVLIGTTTDNGNRLQVNGNISGTAIYLTGSNYDFPNAVVMANDTNWTYGIAHPGSEYWMQVKYYGVGDDSRGFRVYNVNTTTVDFRVNGLGNGIFRGSVTGTAFYESSDIRLKTLIESNPIIDGIEKLEAKLYEKNGKIELGYFAQDAELIMPHAVQKATDGFLNLSYREVHTAKIARLEKEVAELKAQLNLN